MKNVLLILTTLLLLSTTAFASEKHDLCVAYCGGSTYECNQACATVW